MAITDPTGQPQPYQPGEYAPIAPPNLVTFALQRVGPPSPIYIQRDDVIGITAVSIQNGEVLNVNGRFLRASDGVIVPFTYSFSMGNSFNVRQFTFALGEGYLLALNCNTTQAQRRGQTFVSCSLMRGKIVLSPSQGLFQILFQDYCHQNTFTGWPGGMIGDALSGVGAPNSYGGSNPGAGADFTVLAPSSSVFYFASVLYVQATLTTSATVANRLVNLQIAGLTQQHFGAISAIAASATVTLTWAAGASAYTDALGNQHMPLTSVVQCSGSPGTAFANSTTTNLQAGDQWSAITVGVIEYVTLL